MSHMRRFLLTLILLFTVTGALWADEGGEEEEPKGIFYHEIKPALVSNLASGGNYVRCDIQLMTNDESFLEALQLHDPAIRHTLLLLLSEQDGNEIKKPEGKEALRKQAITQISKLMKEETDKDAVKALFFTTFFVQ